MKRDINTPLGYLWNDLQNLQAFKIEQTLSQAARNFLNAGFTLQEFWESLEELWEQDYVLDWDMIDDTLLVSDTILEGD